LRWRGTCYRGHDPRWAWTPLSGEGAAIRGGRFNPKGVPALYLALTLSGVFVEMGHGFGRALNALTICSYEVDVDDIVDLRTDADRKREGVGLDALSGAWIGTPSTPPSWIIAQRLIDRGAAGLLVPSFATGATADMANLVLWTWGPDRPHRIEVHDPSGRLPKNDLSWT
jgi:RES domain-containing protein